MKDVHDLPDGAGHAAAGRPTASSLLERVRSADADAWSRLARLYGPLVHHWARRNGVGGHDAADVVQEVFQVVHQKISSFRRARPGDSFRKWLKAIANNKIREHWRRVGRQAVAEGGSAAQLRINQLADLPHGVEESSGAAGEPQDDAEIGWLHRRAMELVRNEFASTTWRAFYAVIVEERAAADVAAELGVSRNAVYIAKSRVLSRLRIEFADLLNENHEPPEDRH